MTRKNKQKFGKNNRVALPPKVVVEGKKAVAVLNGKDPYDKEIKVGRPSYANKAQQAHDDKKIASVIACYRESNPECSFTDVYKVLHQRFPWIFDAEEMHGSNIRSVIIGYKPWRDAYFVNTYETIKYAELLLAERLEDDAVETHDVLAIYDKMQKYDIARKQLAMDKEDEHTKTDTENTMSNIMEGLKELGAGGLCE